MKKTIISLLTILMAIVIVFSIFLFNTSRQPFKQAKAEAIKIAKETAGMTTTDEFYWYNNEETYFSVSGTNQKKEKLLVIVEQKGGKVLTLKQGEFISEQAAKKIVWETKKPAELLETRVGIEEGVPVWEVAYKQKNGRLGYYVVTAKEGKWVKDIENI